MVHMTIPAAGRFELRKYLSLCKESFRHLERDPVIAQHSTL